MNRRMKRQYAWSLAFVLILVGIASVTRTQPAFWVPAVMLAVTVAMPMLWSLSHDLAYVLGSAAPSAEDVPIFIWDLLGKAQRRYSFDMGLHLKEASRKMPAKFRPALRQTLVLPEIPLSSAGVDTSAKIGDGAEAEIFLTKGLKPEAVKLLRPERHQTRAIWQQKLRKIPEGLPGQVIAPNALLVDNHGTVIGYKMMHLPNARTLGDLIKERVRGQLSDQEVHAIGLSLCELRDGLHRAGVVIGEINPENFLVLGTTVLLVDFDSCQFGGFDAKTWNPDYLSPEAAKLIKGEIVLSGKYNQRTDNYGINVLLFKLYTKLHPMLSGVQKGPTAVPFKERVFQDISVHHPTVRVSERIDTMPIELYIYFEDFFLKGKRGLVLNTDVFARICGKTTHVPTKASQWSKLPLEVVKDPFALRELTGSVKRLGAEVFAPTHEDGALRYYMVSAHGTMTTPDGVETALSNDMRPLISRRNVTAWVEAGKVNSANTPIAFESPNGIEAVRADASYLGNPSVAILDGMPIFALGKTVSYLKPDGTLMPFSTVPEDSVEFFSGSREVLAAHFSKGSYAGADLMVWDPVTDDIAFVHMEDVHEVPGKVEDIRVEFSPSEIWIMLQTKDGQGTSQYLMVYGHDGAVKYGASHVGAAHPDLGQLTTSKLVHVPETDKSRERHILLTRNGDAEVFGYERQNEKFIRVSRIYSFELNAILRSGGALSYRNGFIEAVGGQFSVRLPIRHSRTHIARRAVKSALLDAEARGVVPFRGIPTWRSSMRANVA